MYTTRVVKMKRLIYPSHPTIIAPYVGFADFNPHDCYLVSNAKHMFKKHDF